MSDLTKHLEHTLLKPDSTQAEIRRLCEEAQQHQLAAVCIPPFYVRDARRWLGENSRIRIATVVGFPLGYTAIAAKSEEIRRAIDDGADDIDAVVNLAAVKSGNWNHVHHDVDSIARATHLRGRIVKLILECGLLNAEETARLCETAREHGIAYLKTGTGFNGYPATPEMVQLLRAAAPPNLKIKAAGGIRTRAVAEALLAAGADRLGTSASMAILAERK